jgi:methenyltetrahydromethanopterin cyclohydrolase
MSRTRISVNLEASKLVNELLNNPNKFGVIIKEAKSGASIIDAGIKAHGGFLAGKVITEICMGGLGQARLLHRRYRDADLPTISVFTDIPAIATLGSQFAGWNIRVDGYSAIGSGPARALSLKPKSIYEMIDYRDSADKAVLVLETSEEPPEKVIGHISKLCDVKPENLFVILTPTSSVVGSTQVSGRIVETGIHKLAKLGLEPRLIKYAHGYAPIMPVHPDRVEAMGRVNDAIIYGGAACCLVEFDGTDETLRGIVEKSVSSASEQYGRPFAEIFREAGFDFYKVDSNLFAPAALTVNDIRTGKTFTAGRINAEVIVKSSTL